MSGGNITVGCECPLIMEVKTEHPDGDDDDELNSTEESSLMPTNGEGTVNQQTDKKDQNEEKKVKNEDRIMKEEQLDNPYSRDPLNYCSDAEIGGGTSSERIVRFSESRSPCKGVRLKSYTIDFKLKVVEMAKSTNNTNAARLFNVDRKRVIEWKKQENELKAMSSMTVRKRRGGGGRKVSHPDIEAAVRAWIIARRDAGDTVTCSSLKKECLRLHQQNGNNDFKASCGWLRKFVKRNQVFFKRSTDVRKKKEELFVRDPFHDGLLHKDIQFNGSRPSHKGVRLKSYTIEFKLKVVETAKSTNNTNAARLFNIDRKRVIEWKKQENELKAMSALTVRKRRGGGGRKVCHPDIEAAVRAWIITRRDAGDAVTCSSLRKECLRLHHQNGNSSFKASYGWLRKFMKRNQLLFKRSIDVRQKNGQLLSNMIQGFQSLVNRLRNGRQYDVSFIGNMGEITVWIDYVVDETDCTETIAKSTRHEKCRITIMLCALANGTKLSPMVLLPSLCQRCKVPSGIIVKIMPTSGPSEEVILYWLKTIWQRDDVNRRLLIWDSFSGHVTPMVKEAVGGRYNSDMAVIPDSYTSTLQPCDVSWKRPFKDGFRDLYNEWLRRDVDVGLTEVGANKKVPTNVQLLHWIKDAWASVSPDLVRKSFKVTGISMATDSTQDHMLFQDISNKDTLKELGDAELETIQNGCESLDGKLHMALDSTYYIEPGDVDQVGPIEGGL